MRGYETHEMTAAMLAPAVPDDRPDIDTLWTHLREREVIPEAQGSGSTYPNQSYVAAANTTINETKEKADAWLAANPPPAA